ncbi:hypothetical protein JCM3770_001917 [Rhodotorula araucariae]
MSTPTAPDAAAPPPAPQQQQSPEEQALVLFARAALDLFDMWPALRLAISHGWGGDGAEGKTALAEDVVDLVYTAATSGPSPAAAAGASTSSSSSMQEGGIALPAQDDVAATLLHVVGNEFDVDLEDGSEVLVARDLLALWRECLRRVLDGKMADEGELARRFREGGERARLQDRGNRFEAVRVEGDDSSDEDESGSDDDDAEMEGIEEAPELVEARPREEAVVDEDGFELVQPKKKGGRK